MLIGEDFEKIKFEFLGLDLVEPNAFIGDTVILLVALYFAYKTAKLNRNTPFFTYWKWFYIVFGISFFAGGWGHLMYNYWGLPGKYFSWYTGIISAFCIEQAMISIYPKNEVKGLFKNISIVKMVLAFLGATAVFLFVDLYVDPQKGLLIPTLNSVLGLSIALGLFGVMYQKKVHPSFKFLWISALILIPSAIVQGMKINIHPWFDRNDISHILLITGLILYYQTLKEYAKSLNDEQ